MSVETLDSMLPSNAVLRAVNIFVFDGSTCRRDLEK